MNTKQLVDSIMSKHAGARPRPKLAEGTGNFDCKNSRYIFAFGMRDGDEDEDAADMDYEDTIKNVQGALKARGFDITDPSLRRRGNLEIARKTLYYGDGDDDKRVTLKVVVNPGYYDGACFDWELDSPASEFKDERHVAGWADRASDQLIDDFEEVCADYTTVLNRGGTMSSGETIYRHTNHVK